MIAVEMTPQELQEGLAKLKATEGVTLTLASDDLSGHVSMPQLDADFTYASGALSLTNVKKHGIAKFASDNAIQQNLQKLLGTL